MATHAGRKIDLTEVERHILELDAQYNLETVSFDPWQMEHLAQRLEADTAHRRRNALRQRWSKGPWMKEIPPTATNLREQATLIIESFTDRRLQLYDCEPLRRDLLKLRVEEKSYGIRLTSPRDGDGHGDTFSAFALALLVGHELAGKKRFVVTSMVDGPINIGCGLPDPAANLALPAAACIATDSGLARLRERHLKRMLDRIDVEIELNKLDHERMDAGGPDLAGRGDWLRLLRRAGRI